MALQRERGPARELLQRGSVLGLDDLWQKILLRGVGWDCVRATCDSPHRNPPGRYCEKGLGQQLGWV